MICPKCKGKRIVKSGFKMLASGSTLQRWQCRECGKYFMSPLEPIVEKPKPLMLTLE